MYGACDLEKNIKILWTFFEINVLNIHTRIKGEKVQIRAAVQVIMDVG